MRKRLAISGLAGAQGGASASWSGRHDGKVNPKEQRLTCV